MTRPRHPIATAIVCAALVTTTAACTHNDPTPSPATTTATSTPTPTPTPTPTLTLSAEQQQIEDAKATYVDYVEAINTVAIAGMSDWMEKVVAPYLAGDEREKRVSYYTQASEQGLRQTGEMTVASLTVTEYTPNPAGDFHETLTFEVCLDNSAVDVVDPAGTSVLLEGFPDRLITVETMRRQEDGRWTLIASNTDQARPC